MYELFGQNFLRSFKTDLRPILNKYIGYSKKYKSLTISIFNKNNKVETIAIRKAFDKDGNEVKWKTYGSKKFIPYKIKDNYIFLAVGMAEIILLESMDVSYILLQADGMYRHISQDLINQTVGKNIIILKENDNSFESLILKLQEIFTAANIIVIDFEKVLKTTVPKGYDFRDFCKRIGNIVEVERLLEDEIISSNFDVVSFEYFTTLTNIYAKSKSAGKSLLGLFKKIPKKSEKNNSIEVPIRVIFKIHNNPAAKRLLLIKVISCPSS